MKPSDVPCSTQIWRCLRHGCCIYGWYSIIVMPIITAGCLLSLYSTFGCDFVNLEVGFTPSNSAWNHSSAHIGLFSMYTGAKGDNKFEETFLEGCQRYSDDFEETFISEDRTWKVARIMALIAGGASVFATITSWLFICTPLPASFFWPGLLLPTTLVAFLAEGSKFLMFDTAICRTSTWTPIGVDSLAQRAESCTLGNTAVHTIISGCIFFIALMFVCLKAPEKRTLDTNYGYTFDDYEDDNLQRNPSIVDVESVVSGGDNFSEESFSRGSDVYIVGDTASHTERSGDIESVSGRSIHSRKNRRLSNHRSQEVRPVRSESPSVHSEHGSSGGRDPMDGRESRSARRHPEESFRDDIADTSYPYVSKPPFRDGRATDDRMSAAEIAIRRSEQQRISESRVSKLEKMEQNSTADADDLIKKFVSDLNLSFQHRDSDSGLAK